MPTLTEIEENPEECRLSTAPYDPRFPNTNQTKHCWQNYIDFHLCTALYTKNDGEEDGRCQRFKRNYLSLCPEDWVSKWDEQREAGIYPSDLEP